jgi:hypothetical protein
MAPLFPLAPLAVVFCICISATDAQAHGGAKGLQVSAPRLSRYSGSGHRQHAKVVHVQRHAAVHFRTSHFLTAHSKGNADSIPGQPRLVFRDRGENRNQPGSGEQDGKKIAGSHERAMHRVDVNAATKTNKLAKSGQADPLLGSHVTKYSQAVSDRRLISSTRNLTRAHVPNLLGSHHKIKL